MEVTGYGSVNRVNDTCHVGYLQVGSLSVCRRLDITDAGGRGARRDATAAAAARPFHADTQSTIWRRDARHSVADVTRPTADRLARTHRRPVRHAANRAIRLLRRRRRRRISVHRFCLSINRDCFRNN